MVVGKRSLLSLWGRHLVGVALLSLTMSLIALSQPLYMLNLYDRVLASQSVPTLLSLTFITLFLLACFGGFDYSRSLIQARMGVSVDEAIRPLLMEVSMRQAAVGGKPDNRLARLDDLKNFVTGGAFSSLFDLIFVPVYFTALYLFHPLIGVFCTITALFLVLMALVPEWSLKKPLTEYWHHKMKIKKDQEALLRNAGELVVLGGIGGALKKFFGQQQVVEEQMGNTQTKLNSIQAVNKSIMMMIQTTILGLAAYLVVVRDIQTGVMFAVNIVALRALQPLFAVTSSFKSLNKAVSAWSDISEDLVRYKEDERALQPLESANLAVRSLTILNRIEDRKVLSNINMDLDPGEMVVVTGHSGAGKSTLLRAVVGLLPDYVGMLTLDGRELKHWRFDRTCAYIGYLPQDIQLFNAPIKDNITLYDPDGDLEKVIALCTELGVHDDIAALKDGYGTMVDAERPQFSGGQLRLLGLARAFYGSPRMLALDEPTSGLDTGHEIKVLQFLRARQQQGAAILIASHSPVFIRAATKVLWLKWGQAKAYGLRDDVLRKMGMGLRDTA